MKIVLLFQEFDAELKKVNINLEITGYYGYGKKVTSCMGRGQVEPLVISTTTNRKKTEKHISQSV